MHIVKTLIVGLVIAWGVLALAVRSATPLLGEYRDELAAYASGQLGTPVSIGGLKARWYGLRPLLEMRDVTLGAAPESIAVDRVELDLALTRLLRGSLLDALRVTVDGLELTAVREPGGQVHLEGLRRQETGQESEPPRLPSHLRLLNTRVTWIDRKTASAPLPFDDVNILIDRDGDAVRLRANLQTPAGSAQLAARLRGRLTGTDWSGDSYLRVDSLDLARLFASYVPEHYGLRSARLDLQSWASWTQATPVHSQGGFALSRLELQPQDRPALHIKRMAAEFSVSRDPGRLQIGFKDLVVQTPEQQWPRGDLALSLDSGQQGERQVRLAADYLRLDDLRRIVQIHPPSDTVKTALDALQPGGQVHDLRLTGKRTEAGLTWHAKARFSRLRTLPWDAIPGVENLGGELLSTQAHTVLTLDSDDATLRFTRLFRDPLELPRIAGRVDFVNNDSGWQLVSEKLQADAAHLDTVTRMRVTQRPGESLFVDLQSDFRNGDAAFASRYYPTGVMGERLVSWLDGAIKSGRVVGGSALFYGPVDEFAFEASRSGSFQVVFDAEDLTIDYRDGWPPLQQLVARAKFHGNQLDISARDGRIYDSRIESVTARIASLKPITPIRIRGQVDGPLQNALRVLNEPALRDRFGQFAETLRGAGDSRLDLDFTLPLGRLGSYTLNGQLTFDNNRLSLPDWDFAMSDIAGRLDFTLDGLQAKGITATALGAPISVDVLPAGEGSTRVRATGRFQPKTIATVAKGLPTGIAQGTASFLVDVDIPPSLADAKSLAMLSVNSDLQGIGIDLPAPLGKSTAGKRELSVRIPLSGRGVPGSVRYGDRLSARFSKNAERVDVMLGGADATLRNERGIRIGGRVTEVDVAAWTAALERLPKTTDADSPPLSVDLLIDRVQVDTYAFDKLQLNAQRDRESWRGSLNAKNLAGRFAVPLNRDRATIQVDLERLALKLPQDTNDAIPPAPDTAAGPDPATLPGLALSVADLQIDKARLGKLRFVAQATGSGLRITQFTLQDGQLQLDANGNWTRDGKAFATQFSGRVSSSDLGQLLVDLGYSQQLAGSSASSEFLFDWPGNPAQLHRAMLRGQLKLKVDQGRLVELDPGVTRVVGLLNLNALTRRLKLDFTDFYKKGYSFDSITGDFLFDRGEAVTENLTMTGPTGRIEITGAADLMARTLDQKVAVTPNLDATLPIAGTIAGGPVAGIAVLVAQRVMNKEVDSINRFDYSLTGPWASPEVTQLDSGGTLSKLLKPFSGGGDSAVQAPAKDTSRPATDPVQSGPAANPAEQPLTSGSPSQEPQSHSPAGEAGATADAENSAADGQKKAGPLRRLIDMLKKGEPHGADFPGTPD